MKPVAYLNPNNMQDGSECSSGADLGFAEGRG